jgi:hypothetical protein
MSTTTVRKIGRARKAKAPAKEVTSFDRLWLACRLMTLTRDECDQVFEDLHGFHRNFMQGREFASKSNRESDVPRLVHQLTDARIHSLLEKVRLIHRRRNEQQRTRRLERRSLPNVGQDGGCQSAEECILKLVP